MTKFYKHKIKLIYVWSILFLMAIYVFTMFSDYDGLVLYLIYFIFALPYYKYLDKLAIVCFLVSTLQDYFAGSDANVWSIYTIFLLIACISIFINRRITPQNIVPFVTLFIAIYISYSQSQFHYTKGALSLFYSIIVCLFIMLFVKIEGDTLKSFLPTLAATIVVLYLVSIITNGIFINSTLTITEEINHNSFGRSLAQMSIILMTRVLTGRKRNVGFITITAVAVVLTLLTGSRNAFLALIVSTIFVYVYTQKAYGRTSKNFFKFGIVALGILLLASLVLSVVTFDLSRFNYIALISGGGTNRAVLWRLLVPEIASKYMIFGYGPSSYCSAQIIYPLIHRAYVNAHNTFIEAWGELGLFGLLPFVWIYINAFVRVKNKTKINSNYLFIFALFVNVFINGLGESMFGGINLWMLIGFCYCNFQQSQYTHSKQNSCLEG